MGVVAEDPKAEDVFMTEAPIKSSFQSTEPEWLIGMTMAEAAQLAPGKNRTYLLDCFKIVLNHMIKFYFVCIQLTSITTTKTAIISTSTIIYYCLPQVDIIIARNPTL